MNNITPRIELFIERLKDETLTEEEKEFFLEKIGDKEVSFLQGWLGGSATGGSRYHHYNFSQLTYTATGGHLLSKTIVKKFDTKKALLEFMLQKEAEQ